MNLSININQYVIINNIYYAYNVYKNILNNLNLINLFNAIIVENQLKIYIMNLLMY